mgnify:CR=1 FL=1
MKANLKGAALVAFFLVLKYQDDDDEDFDAVMRRFLGEFLYKGPVNYFTNLSIADRVGWTDLIWREQKGDRADASAVSQFFEGLLGAPYSILKNFEKGFDQIAEGHFERGIETMLPAALKNILKGGRYALEGANTLRGDPIVGDISAYNAGAQFFGFAPAEYTRQLEINASLKNIERRATKERTKVLRDYYIAARNGDADGMADAIEDMMKFNKLHPSAAITAETVQNSMAQHMKTSQEMYHGVTLNKKLRSELLQNAAEYDNGLLD